MRHVERFNSWFPFDFRQGVTGVPSPVFLRCTLGTCAAYWEGSEALLGPGLYKSEWPRSGILN